MTEINNNIPNFGQNKIHFNKAKSGQETEQPVPKKGTEEEVQYVPDTGVLGRSQVVQSKGGDIPATVDETVKLVENNPAFVSASESVFNTIYGDLISQGYEPSDAYMKALFAEEKFYDMARNNY